MNIGLDLVPEEDYVWFLNASDRLASPDSLSKVVYRLNLEKTGPRNRVAWMLGRTVVSEKTQTYFLPLGESGAEFVKKLRSGKVGFPHSSTVANAGLLREIGTFAKKFNVANDYLMSLELNQVAGPPEIIDHPLSFYDQKGESGRRPLSTYTSKLFVRMGFFGPTFITREPQHALWATLRWLARASAASKTFWSFAKFLEWKKPQVHADWHFCKGKEQKTWPGCCEEFILG